MNVLGGRSTASQDNAKDDKAYANAVAKESVFDPKGSSRGPIQSDEATRPASNPVMEEARQQQAMDISKFTGDSEKLSAEGLKAKAPLNPKAKEIAAKEGKDLEAKLLGAISSNLGASKTEGKDAKVEAAKPVEAHAESMSGFM